MHGGSVGPYWTPISPSAGSFFHAGSHLGELLAADIKEHRAL